MHQSCSVIFFSKNRAMQLHASISSLKKHALFYQWADVFVLYKVDKNQHQYDKLSREFPEVSFIREIHLVEQVRDILSKYDATMFVVDDTLFYRDFNLTMCVHHLFSRADVLGFSLRLGYNINWSHIKNDFIKQPEFHKMIDNYYYFSWPEKDKDFGYPLEVSSSIYRSQDIYPLLEGIRGDPGVIEGHLNDKKRLFVSSKSNLLCFDHSVAFAVPVNIVRSKTFCPAGREYPQTSDNLALLFDAGKRIDISIFPELVKGCHQEMEYKYI